MKMCQALALNGHQVTLLAPKRRNQERGVEDLFSFYGVKKCFQVKHLPYPESLKGKTFLYSFLAAAFCKTKKPDLVLSRHLTGAFFCSLFKIKIIYEAHSPISSDENTFNVFAFNKLIRSRFFCRLVVISEYLRRLYSQIYPELANKIEVFHDSAEPVPENTKPVISAKEKRSLIVGYIGHLYKGRGIEVIVGLASTFPEAEYHIIGGTHEDIEYWKGQTKKLQNIFIHGFIEPGKIYNYIESFDVLLAPYQHKVSVAGGAGNTVQWMSPLKIFEYMSSGKIILASRLPALQEILIENNNCLMAEPETIEEWAGKLKLVYDNPDAFKHLGLQAKNDFNNKHTWEKRAQKIIGLSTK
jgi:glycosyltransferase involved in cell wall biosynthesis